MLGTKANKRFNTNKKESKKSSNAKQDKSNGTKTRDSTISTNEYVFEGKFDRTSMEGTGKLTLKDGTIMEGKFKDFKLFGQGMKTLANGTVLKGNFVSSRLYGKGIKETDSGDIYEGVFENDCLNGRGTLTKKNGEKQSGTFKDDLLHGKGMITDERKTESFYFANDVVSWTRTVKSGEFKAGVLNGNGSICEFDFLKSRKTFDCKKEQNRVENELKDKFFMISKIEGVFVDGELNGEGLEETFFELKKGNFVGGVLNGKGVLYKYEDQGKCWNMMYKHKEPSELFSRTYESNVWHSSQPIQSIKEGDFVDGQLEGYGKIVDDAIFLEGQFTKGELDGEGVFINDKMKMEGVFEKGVLKKGKIEILRPMIDKKHTIPLDSKENYIKLNFTFNKIGVRIGTVYKGVFEDVKLLKGKGIVQVPNEGEFEGEFNEGLAMSTCRTIKLYNGTKSPVVSAN